MRIWQEVRDQLDPTVVNSLDGVVDCDISLFSRLCQLSERVQWIGQVSEEKRSRYSQLFDIIHGERQARESAGENVKIPPKSTFSSLTYQHELNEDSKELPMKSLKGLPSYDSLQKEIKNTFSRLACGSQVALSSLTSNIRLFA